MRFVPNPAATRLLARTPEMQAFLKLKADAAVEAAKAIAPEESGDYKDGIEAHSGTFDGKAAASIAGHDYKTLWIELGTEFRSAEAILRRGAEAVGIIIGSKDGP